MKHLLILASIALSASAFAAPKAEKAASAPTIDRANSALQSACIDKVKKTLKGAERIRDIGSAKGTVESDITFAISENGGKTRAVSCQVQPNGTLTLVDKGSVSKG